MLKKFLTLLAIGMCIPCAHGESLSKFETKNKKFGQAKILNQSVKCHSFAKKGETSMGNLNRYQFTKSRQRRGKIVRTRAGGG